MGSQFHKPRGTGAKGISKLEALEAAGIEYEQNSQLRCKVKPDFSFWPTTERWRSSDGQVSGYGVKQLIQAIRKRTNS